MHIIPRDKLLETLTGPMYDPESHEAEGQFPRREEFAAFANAILADAPESVQYFVVTDHENGDDYEVGWPEYKQIGSRELIPLTYGPHGDYYGLDVSYNDWEGDSPSRRLYNCYLGGSPLNSAPGFVVATARM